MAETHPRNHQEESVTKNPTEKQAEKQTQQQRLTVIGRHVLRSLGEPADLQRVQVRHLWGECYRVNIFAGLDLVSAKVVHSYFLVANETGTILNSVPPVVRAYALSGVDGEASESCGVV